MDKREKLKNLLINLQKQSEQIREIEGDIKKLIQKKSDIEHKREAIEAEALLTQLNDNKI